MPLTTPPEQIYDRGFRARPNNGKHELQNKLAALSIYAETLSQTAASERTGIPVTTIHSWLQEEESDAFIESLRTALRAATAHKLVEICNKSANQMIDRLDNGDEVFDSKQNCMVRVKVKAKDLASVFNTAAEKHALLTGMATTGKTAGALSQLADKLTQAINALPNKQATDE